MERRIITTGDGSATIFLPEWNEHYHSKHGAINEAYHVFLKMGLEFLISEGKTGDISILEMGFGTGLNALITFLEGQKKELSIDYTAIEAYPVSEKEVAALNYAQVFSGKTAVQAFDLLHKVPWEKKEEISPSFSLLKKQMFFSEVQEKSAYDLIYFDAFGPRVQPDLWTEDMFASMYASLRENGVLVTYSAKGSVRRAMEAVGFQVERLPGPPGKREMLRGAKTLNL